MFSEHSSTLDSPVRSALAVVPSNTADLAQVTRGVYVGQTGDLALTMADGSTVTFANVQAGSLLPLRAVRIRATGTTATSILALW